MKFKKLLVLAGTAVMLMACGGNAKSTTPAASVEPATSTEAASSEVVTPSTPAPVSVTPSSAAPASSSSATPAPSTATPSSSTQTADRYELSFRNTVASCGNTKLAETLTAYVAGETNNLCTGVTVSGSGEVESIDDTVLGTFTILKIGAKKAGGELTFTFSKNIKSIILDVENYHKTFATGTSQDTGVKLYVNTESTVIDLSATAAAPTKKTQEVTINAKTFKLFTKGEQQRAFVNGITFVL